MRIYLIRFPWVAARSNIVQWEIIKEVASAGLEKAPADSGEVPERSDASPLKHRNSSGRRKQAIFPSNPQVTWVIVPIWKAGC